MPPKKLLLKLPKLFKTLLKLYPVILVFLLTGLLVYFLFYGFFFKINSVKCQIDGALCSLDYEKAFYGVYGQNIFLLNEKDIKAKAQKQNPIIDEVNIRWVFPSRLEIILSKREAKIQLSKDYKSFYFADNKGIIFSEGEKNSHLPLVKVYDEFPIKLGIVSADLKKCGMLFEQVKKYEIQIKDLFLNADSTAEAYFNRDKKIIFSLEKDINKQVASLQLILSRSKIEGKSIRSLDLRFDKAIAIFEDE